MVSNIFFIFTPILGEMIQFEEHIFQMGWFHHQLEIMAVMVLPQTSIKSWPHTISIWLSLRFFEQIVIHEFMKW